MTEFIRSNREKGFSVIDNTVLRDDRLSWKAKGIFCYILSLPEHWKIYLKELMTHSKDGEASFRGGIKELETYGYLQKQRRQDELGKFNGFDYVVIESPPYGDFPHVEKPNVEKPNVENRKLVNTNKSNNLNNKILNKKEPAPLIPKQSSKSKKAKDIVTMKQMARAFTENEDVQDALLEYLDLRVKKGLQPNQWKIILEDLRKYAKQSSQVALDEINGAIAGGYMQIIADWKKGSRAAASGKFDNTARKETRSAKKLTRAQLREELAEDEDGNLLQF